MRCIFLSLSFLLAYPSFAEVKCKIRPRFISRIDNNPNLIEKRLDRCLQRHIDGYNFHFHYLTESFSDSDGDFVYYRKAHGGDVLFSERWFNDSDGFFYYFRHRTGNEHVFYSTRSFEDSDGLFKYYRKRKGNLDVMWSTRRFTSGENIYTYFRRSNDNDQTMYSLRILEDSSDRVIYFREKSGSASKELCSIKNGRFRDGERNVISARRFFAIFLHQFWKPLVRETVRPTAAYLDQEVAKYLIF